MDSDDIEDGYSTLPSVDLIASGYDWNCPKCGSDHTCNEVPRQRQVTCGNCNTVFLVGDYHHAVG